VGSAAAPSEAAGMAKILQDLVGSNPPAASAAANARPGRFDPWRVARMERLEWL